MTSDEQHRKEVILERLLKEDSITMEELILFLKPDIRKEIEYVPVYPTYPTYPSTPYNPNDWVVTCVTNCADCNVDHF